jgi:hypothetical protein
VQAGAIDHLTSLLNSDRAQSRNAALANAYIPQTHTVVIDDGAALEHQIERFHHFFLRIAACPAALPRLPTFLLYIRGVATSNRMFAGRIRR